MAEIKRKGLGQERGPYLSRFYKEMRSGGKSANPYVLLLGLEPLDTVRLVERVEDGFSYRELDCLRSNVGLSRDAVADLVSITARTLDRRKEKNRLKPEESDRLLRASRIFGQAISLFEGDVEAAKEWLSSPQGALGGAVPLGLAKTEIGAREVDDLIGRLEHGVFS